MTRKRTTRSVDAIIAAIAARQHGVVERLQLIAAGVTVAQIEGRIRRGLLIRLHQGVYAVGHAVLRPVAHRLAAVLACGSGALLGVRGAAAHWQIRPSAAAAIDVISPQGAGRRRAGVRVHRMEVEPWERTIHDAVPVTTPARTMLDLAEVVPRRALERAMSEAENLRLFDLAAIERVLHAHPRRHGAARLRAALDRAAVGDELTRSELEERVLAICERHAPTAGQRARRRHRGRLLLADSAARRRGRQPPLPPDRGSVRAGSPARRAPDAARDPGPAADEPTDRGRAGRGRGDARRPRPLSAWSVSVRYARKGATRYRFRPLGDATE